MATSPKAPGIRWTPANVVTTVRIACIPVLALMMLTTWADANVQAVCCLVFFALISLTDSLDGYLARSRNEVTTFGKFMDPIADKLLVVAAMLALVEQGALTAWVPLVIVCREFLVSGLRMVAASAGVVIAASKIGKAKTLVTMVALCLFILMGAPAVASVTVVRACAWVLMTAAVILTVWSMVDYFAKAWGLLAEGGAQDAPEHAEHAESVDACERPAVAEARADSLEARVARQAAATVAAAREAGVTLGTAESLTGGMICAALTSVPGSSEVVAGGVDSYMARVKRDVLGVPGRVIEDKGVVSSPVAARMASGAASKLDVDVAVAVTGVAGPGGGTPETPVGTVWFGLACASGAPTTETRLFSGDRAEVRLQTTLHALELLESGVREAASRK